MQVRDVMRHIPTPMDSAETVRVAAEIMKRENVGCLLVGDEGHLEGIVTDRDLSLRCIAEGRHPASTPVCQVMSVGIITCREDETIGDVIERMTDHGVVRLAVVNRKGRVVGVISARDSVRSVPLSKLARSKLTEVRFSKEIPTSRGRIRRVPVQTVYVTGGAGEARARREAIKRFQSDHGVEDWRQLADELHMEHAA